MMTAFTLKNVFTAFDKKNKTSKTKETNTVTTNTIAAVSDTVPVIDVQHLNIAYANKKDEFQRVVHDVSFSIKAGEVVALVGESGSGKTTTSQAIIGLLSDNGRIESGKIALNGTDITHWSDKQLDSIRGSVISLVPQDPGSSLNPVLTIGEQVGEIFKIHHRLPEKDIPAQVLQLLERVGLTQPALRIKQYPHELSGGMKQRVLIAIAIALKPALIIADEPTSALDVTVQRRILDLIDDIRQEVGTAVLLVTHDLGVASDRADRIVVMQKGRIEETGTVAQILRLPKSDYTRKLLNNAPALTLNAFRTLPKHAAKTDLPEDIAIAVEGLVHEFEGRSKKEKLRAVNGVSFTVRRGTTHAIVGESGSGKTTTIRDIVGFGKPTAGKIVVNGTDITSLHKEKLRQFRKHIQLVYQNPFGSLDPKQTIFEVIEEPLLNYAPVPSKAERATRIYQALEQVGLPKEVALRQPNALSGGQRQRVAIARALILKPAILVLDEAVSALDVTVQAQILTLLNELQAQLGLTYLFITHDLSVVKQVADTVTVLQHGEQIENGAVETVFREPKTTYTKELIRAIPGKRSSYLVTNYYFAI